MIVLKTRSVAVLGHSKNHFKWRLLVISSGRTAQTMLRPRTGALRQRGLVILNLGRRQFQDRRHRLVNLDGLQRPVARLDFHFAFRQ